MPSKQGACHEEYYDKGPKVGCRSNEVQGCSASKARIMKASISVAICGGMQEAHLDHDVGGQGLVALGNARTGHSVLVILRAQIKGGC